MTVRESRACRAVIAGLFLSACGCVSLAAGAESAKPGIVVPGNVSKTNRVEITGLSKSQLGRLAKAKLSRVLVVGVAPKKGSKTNPSAMFGEHKIANGRLVFEPEFPFRAGVRYRVVFNPAAIPGEAGGRVLRRDFLIPRPKPTRDAIVTQVFPTAKVLPENLLKFYVHFSVPMSRGEAYRRIALIDAATGKTVDHPFLEVGEELWDPAGTRFTLYFEPGRIKRGLKPREDLGPALVNGKSYRLVIDAKWRTADGRTLKAGYTKAFRVGEPDETQPSHERWKVVSPTTSTRKPLVLQFDEALDQAMLMRVLKVQNSAGREVTGKIVVDRHERRWRFTPAKPWKLGGYSIRVETTLEDLAGNSIGQPFEVDPEKRKAKRPVRDSVSVPFVVRGR